LLPLRVAVVASEVGCPLHPKREPGKRASNDNGEGEEREDDSLKTLL